MNLSETDLHEALIARFDSELMDALDGRLINATWSSSDDVETMYVGRNYPEPGRITVKIEDETITVREHDGWAVLSTSTFSGDPVKVARRAAVLVAAVNAELGL